jgi:hypothetical protein
MLPVPVAVLKSSVAKLPDPTAVLDAPLANEFAPHSNENSPTPPLHSGVASACAADGQTIAKASVIGATAARKFEVIRMIEPPC